MTFKRVLFIFFATFCLFYAITQQNQILVDITLMFDKNVTTSAANKQHWKELANFFVHNFGITDTVTSENRIRVCLWLFSEPKKKPTITCGGVNSEIFVHNLSQVDKRMNKTFERDKDRITFPHIVAIVVNNLQDRQSEYSDIVTLFSVKKVFIIVLTTPAEVENIQTQFQDNLVIHYPYIFYPFFYEFCKMIPTADAKCESMVGENETIKCKNVSEIVHPKCPLIECDDSLCNCDELYPWEYAVKHCPVGTCGKSKYVLLRQYPERCMDEKLTGDECSKPCTTTTIITTRARTSTRILKRKRTTREVLNARARVLGTGDYGDDDKEITVIIVICVFVTGTGTAFIFASVLYALTRKGHTDFSVEETPAKQTDQQKQSHVAPVQVPGPKKSTVNEKEKSEIVSADISRKSRKN